MIDCFYDPATGQFLSRDPANALTRSAYAYVYGNPLNATDPSGLCWPDWACSVENAVGLGSVGDALKSATGSTTPSGCNEAPTNVLAATMSVLTSPIAGQPSGTSSDPLPDVKKQLDDYFDSHPPHIDPGACAVVCYDHDFSNGRNNWGVGLALSVQIATWNSNQIANQNTCAGVKAVDYCWDDKGGSGFNISFGAGAELFRRTF